MTIGVLKEPPDETRVSLLPEAVVALSKKGIAVLIENGAGEKAFADDDSYQNAGAQIKNRNELIESSEILLSINSPGDRQVGKILIGVYFPLYDPGLMQQWAQQ